jgi:YgiT-type zinc finger domain-containing protein
MTPGPDRPEVLVERRVTYTLEMNGRLFVVENVPARVNPDTGEQLFSPQTVERLQRMIRGDEQPVRVMETPVYQFAG